MLTVRDHMILDLEEQHPRDNGWKHEAMRTTLSMSPARYYQRLLELVQQRDAVVAAPMLCKRVQRQASLRSRDRRRRVLGK